MNPIHHEALKHVRIVHFALIAASLALGMIATMQPASSLESALSQVQEAARIDKLITKEWLQRALERRSTEIEKRPHPTPAYVPEITVRALIDDGFDAAAIKRSIHIPRSLPSHILFPLVPFHSQFKGEPYRFWSTFVLGDVPLDGFVRLSRATSAHSLGSAWYDPGIAPEPRFIEPPRSLREYRQAWETLNNLRAVSLATFERGSRKWQPITDTWGDESVGETTRFEVVVATLPDAQQADLLIRVETNIGGNPRATFIPLVTSDESLGLIDEALRELGVSPSANLSFNGRFPDLAIYATGLESLRLPEIEVQLRTQRDRAGQGTSIFGITIPPGGVFNWGAILILGTQIYLFVTLRNVRNLQPPIPLRDVAWIGTFPDNLSIVLLIVSTGVLPIVVVSLLALRGLASAGVGGGGLLVLAALASILVALKTIVAWWQWVVVEAGVQTGYMADRSDRERG